MPMLTSAIFASLVATSSAFSLQIRTAPRVPLSRTSTIKAVSPEVQAALDKLDEELSAADAAAEATKEILRGYNSTIENFPQPVAAPAPLRGFAPAVAGLGAGIIVLRQIGEKTKKEREEREARERAEAEARKKAQLTNSATIGIVPAAAIAATIFIGSVIAPPQDGAPISATQIQKASKRVSEAEENARKAAQAKAVAEAAAAKAAALEEAEAVAQAETEAAKAKTEAEAAAKEAEAAAAAKEEVQAAVAQPVEAPPPPPAPVAAPKPPSAPVELPELPLPALGAGAAVAVAAAVALGGGGGEKEEESAAAPAPSAPVASEPPQVVEEPPVVEEVVWPVEGKVTSWYDTGKRL